MTRPDSSTFSVAATDDGVHIRFRVSEHDGPSKTYELDGRESEHYFRFFRNLHEDFGTRLPHTDPSSFPETPSQWRPLLTENVSPTILAGYGDAAVLKTDAGYYLVATSNDAPDAFPILHSEDLIHWEHKGFVFPEGQQPAWTASGRFAADFWASEMAKIGDEYWVAFTARQTNGSLAIGVARSTSPTGPFVDNGQPLISGSNMNRTGVPQ